MLTEKQQARLDELEWLEKSGNLTNGERIRLRELRDLVAMREQINHVATSEPTHRLAGSVTGRTPGEPQPQFSVAPRQAGKSRRQEAAEELLQGSTYSPSQHEYILADGSRLTDQALNTMSANAMKVRAQQMNMSATTYPPNTQPFVLPWDENGLTNGTIVKWKSKHVFTYVAVYAGAFWNISGAGIFYGGNRFTHAEFIAILQHPEVTNLELVTELKPLVIQ
jgi:hypothetical protein